MEFGEDRKITDSEMDIVKLPKCFYLESSATTGTPFPNPYFTTQEALSRNEQKQGKRILDAGEKRLKKGKKNPFPPAPAPCQNHHPLLR